VKSTVKDGPLSRQASGLENKGQALGSGDLIPMESAHDRTMRTWYDMKPRTVVVNVVSWDAARFEYSHNWNSTPTDGAVTCPKTPAEMREAARELLLRPEETK
jgi:hypothetical protein